jgi:hypothetical protein
MANTTPISGNFKECCERRDEPIEQSDVADVELKCSSFPSHRFSLADETPGFGQIRLMGESTCRTSRPAPTNKKAPGDWWIL